MSAHNRSGAQTAINILSILIIIAGVLFVIAGAFMLYVMDKDGADGIFQIVGSDQSALSQIDMLKSAAVTLICYAVVDIFFGIYGKIALSNASKIKMYKGLAMGFTVLNVYTLVEHNVLGVNVSFYFYPVIQIVIFGLCWYFASQVANQIA